MISEQSWLHDRGKTQVRTSAILLVLLIVCAVFSLFMVISNGLKYTGPSNGTLFQGGNQEPTDILSSSMYPYYPDKVHYRLANDPLDGLQLVIHLKDPSRDTYLGLAFRGEFKIRESSTLEIEWRAFGNYTGLELHLLELQPPGMKGEVFTVLAGRVPETWTTSSFPLDSFTYNMNHDPELVGNKTLDIERLLQFDIGVGTGADMELNIRSLRFVEDRYLPVRIVISLMVFILSVLLIVLSMNRAMYPRQGLARVNDSFTNRLAFVIIAITIITAMLWSDYRPEALPVLVMFLSLGLITFLADQGGNKFQKAAWYPYRFVAIFALALAMGYQWSRFGLVFMTIAAVLPFLDRPDFKQHLVLTASMTILALLGSGTESLESRIPSLIMIAVGSGFVYFLGEIIASRNKNLQTKRITQLYESILNGTSDAVCTFTPDGALESSNPGFERLVGGSWQGFAGRKLRDFILESERSHFDAVLSSGTRNTVLELSFLAPDGSVRKTLAKIQAQVEEGQIFTYQAILVDRSELDRLEDELKQNNEILESMEVRDSLTGVSNRRFFLEQLNTEWARAVRQQSELALLVLGVDQFNDYEASYGHHAGNDLLKSLAAVLSDQVRRSGELLCRYGNDTFVVILPHHDQKTALALAERMRCAVLALGLKKTSISLGLASIDPLMTEASQLISAGEAALALARAGGGNQVSSGIGRGALPT